MTEFNSSGSFNFSIQEALGILQEHRIGGHNVNETTQVILIFVYGLLMVSGLTANMLVSLVVAFRPQMRTPKNLYIVNLTVSDITLCLICMPFTLISILSRQWTMGLFLCKLVPVVQGSNIMVSVGTITVIALDRYWTIVRSQNSVNNRHGVVKSIVLVWVIAVFATLPVAFYQVVEPFTFHRVVLYEACIERWPSHKLKILYATCVLLIQSVIPALVVCVVHARIASYLHAHASTHKDKRRAAREIQRNRRTTLLLSVVAVIFTISWLPLSIFSLTVDILFSTEPVPQVSPQNLYVALAVCHVTAMSSAISNPVVYGWFNSNIRQEFLQLLPSKCAASVTGPNVGEEATTKTGVTPRRDSVTVLLHNGTADSTRPHQTLVTLL